MARKLVVYFSLLSPWAFIGHGELQKLVRKHALDVDYRPIDLMQIYAATGGTPLAKRHPSRQAYRLLELQRWRDKRGLTFGLWPRFWPFDPGLADRTICALTLDRADPQKFIAGAFSAIFAQNRNLADEHEVAAVLSENGYNTLWLARARSEEAEALYEKNHALALHAGVFGSPSYVLDGELFWGQDRLELLDEALTSGRPPFSAEI